MDVITPLQGTKSCQLCATGTNTVTNTLDPGLTSLSRRTSTARFGLADTKVTFVVESLHL